MTENKNRVCCLYRVSTDKQVDFNSNHEADLPMQRKACHKFAEAKGWVIVHEEQEEGVSGHKVRAEARDKLQIIKECPNSRSSRRRSLKLHSVSGKIALPTQRKKPNTMFLFVPVDRHCFPITFTAATVVQGSP